MRIFRRATWSLVVCLSAFSWAQTTAPSLMPFPLELKRTPPAVDALARLGLQQEWLAVVRQTGAQVPDAAKIDKVVGEVKRQDCEREDQCLVQLAARAGTLYALYANLDTTLDGAVVMTGRVVREDGLLVGSLESVRVAVSKGPFKDYARSAMTQLLAKLKIAQLDPNRPKPAVVEVATRPPETKPNAEVGVPPPPPSAGVTASPPAASPDMAPGPSLVLIGVSLVGAGGVIAAIGAGIGGGVQLQGTQVPIGQLDTILAARTLTTVGFIGMGLGVVSAAIGGVLWGTSKPRVAVNFGVDGRGAWVQLGGRF